MTISVDEISVHKISDVGMGIGAGDGNGDIAANRGEDAVDGHDF